MKENYSSEEKIDPIQEQVHLDQQLSRLFGTETVEQAHLVDVTDLGLNEDMITCITTGLARLKQLRENPAAQRDLVGKMTQGERLLLCMWIMDMGLLDKIQTRQYA